MDANLRKFTSWLFIDSSENSNENNFFSFGQKLENDLLPELLNDEYFNGFTDTYLDLYEDPEWMKKFNKQKVEKNKLDDFKFIEESNKTNAMISEREVAE